MTVKVTGLFFYFSYIFIFKYECLIIFKYECLKKSGLKSYILFLDIPNYFMNYINSYNFLCLNSFHTLVKTKYRIGPHNEDVISVIIGSLLGDAYGNRKYLEGTRIYFRHNIKFKEYLFWLYEFFNIRGYCSNSKPKKFIKLLKFNSKIKKYYGYEFNTYTFKSFDWLYKMFYRKGKKRIHVNLGKYLTPLALAIWISYEGYWVNKGVRLLCNVFILEEVELLNKILNQNFGLLCYVEYLNISGNYCIFIKSESVSKLRKIVSPFMHYSMLYKLGL